MTGEKLNNTNFYFSNTTREADVIEADLQHKLDSSNYRYRLTNHTPDPNMSSLRR
jgi:hypothetical protein